MRRASFLIACLAALLVAGSARAQSQSPASPEGKAAEQIVPNEDAGKAKQDVQTYQLPPEKYEEAVAYSRAGYRLHFIQIAYSLLLLFIILRFRVAAGLRDRAEKISRRRFAQAFIFVPLLFILFDLLKLPLDIYGQRLALGYGISIQSWGSWFWDWTKGEIISIAIVSVLVYFFYGLVGRSPRRWWLYSGLAMLPLIVFFIFLSPLVIDPLFNKFEPLDNDHPALVSEVEKLVARGGLEIPRERMFEMKASEKVRAIDAYVTGFGSSKRVVVWDTTIASMTEPQTLFVVGHEMGHYVLGHIPKGIAFTGGLILLVLYLVYRSVNWALKRWARRWFLRGLEDWASLPALMFLFSLFVFLAEPAFNTFSRYQEHQADIYGLEITHGVIPDSAQAAAGAFQVLGEIDLADPQPGAFIKFWLYSHPPLAERLAFARDYDPWSEGQPPRFVSVNALTDQ